MRAALLSLFLIVLVWPIYASAQETAPSERANLLNRAVKELNGGHPHEAKATLAELMRRYPDSFRAYSLYWSAVGSTESPEVRIATIRRHLDELDRVRDDKRTEEYYSTVLRGYTELEDTVRANAIRTEAAKKYPRGLVAQMTILKEARTDPDPVRSAAKFQAYIDAFPDNDSWTEDAASQRFELIATHLDRFDTNALIKAGELWEAKARRYVEVFESPTAYVLATVTIADKLADTSPSAALAVIDKGTQFVEQQWTKTTEFDDTARLMYYPAALKAYIATESWLGAERVGSALLRALDVGQRVQGLGSREDEARVRKLYALALEKQNRIDTARLHLAWATTLDDALKSELAAFSSRHPLAGEDLKRFEALLRARIADVQSQREMARKATLLATEQRREATGFELADLEGRRVSLASLKGKVVVVTFWASWCGPCVAELEEWKQAYEAHKENQGVAMLAVTIDQDKAKALALLKKKGYNFPVLLSDGSVEAPYELQTIPKLYVIDRNGFIRFQTTGYDRDGVYLKALNWMITAAAN